MKSHYDDNIEYENDISSHWMITYSDMITIILCFFIIFFTFSAEEISALYTVKDSLMNKVNKLSDENIKLSNENTKLRKEKKSLSEELFNIKNVETDLNSSNEEFISFLRNNNLLKDVSISQKENELIIRFKNSILFDSGSAEITEKGYMVLDKIADKLKLIDNDFVVEGFTDNVPINTKQFPSNWELSSSRAINVVKFFINEKSIDENRISFSGWGERKPIASNTTEEGRAKNRRIEIRIIN
ncbi:OmpA/MotB family protein [Paramaledivibacter caminithermalis]|jgi:chemotaxis protein MotB|uniref:Chemotaxis protein MotB n=1 Tax=Paramaledivibacter caminithermalis (strain DSM 15212 / CIP 107654 / DViRD3) TaxID=1121301 RepID=A0A1M6RCL3_PARC5|nr:OmpA family protein [Paramaledivibacter caminithermalis]SHK30088.1 chemotaxis protein MotB [Paramaledivibacter caminithermalis DSM 15212]